MNSEIRADNRPTILVVDDLLANLYAMEKMLAHLDVEVLTVDNPIEGLRILLNRQIDVLILDYSMPTMNGAEMAQNIQQQFKEPPPILFVTAHGHDVPGLEAICYDSGGMDFIEKPIKENILLAKLNILLSLSRQKYQLTQMATTDHLTGLLNRFSFQNVIDQAIALCQRQSSLLALFAIDLDKFKEVNDMYGHDAGDAVLKAISSRLKASLRSSDVAARIGGDEFLVLATNLNSTHEAEMIAEKILENCCEEVLYKSLKLPVSLSIGIAFYPSHATTVEQLKKSADLALYKAKESGRSCLRLFSKDEELNSQYFDTSLTLRYQPIIDPSNKELLGVEILTGLVGAEKYGGIKEALDHFRQIGQSAQFEHALCKKLEEELAQFPDKYQNGIRLFLNQNILELIRGEHIEELVQLNEKLKQHKSHLVLELDGWEKLMRKNNFLKPLNILAAQGIELCFQDVGEQMIPNFLMESICLSYIKISRSLMPLVKVDDVSQAVIRSVSNIAKATKCKVIAVGVENEQQFKYLQELGVDDFQGFYLQPPLSMNELVSNYFEAR